MKAIVFGGTGFVGSAVMAALRQRGADVKAATGPRLGAVSPQAICTAVGSASLKYSESLAICRGADVVVNAAGVAVAGSANAELLAGANSVLPGLVARAARDADVPRFIHISSAAVQGRARLLTADPAQEGFSDYSWSKIMGERMVAAHGPPETVIFRPAGVHGRDRVVSRSIARIASSPLASVASPGTQPTPQGLIDNVADAVAFLASTSFTPDPIVTYPWEGLTVASLLELLGGRIPLLLPNWMAERAIGAIGRAAAILSRLQAQSRRMETLWMGQAQANSWLTERSWTPPHGEEAWRILGEELRSGMR